MPASYVPATPLYFAIFNIISGADDLESRRMDSKTKKGKIAHAEWPAIITRYESGESLASIARGYGCTAPAIRYIVNRETRAATMTTPSMAVDGDRRDDAAASGPGRPSNPESSSNPERASSPERSSVERLSNAAGPKGPELPAPTTSSPIDRELRERVNSDIAVFLVAFDAAFASNSASARAALLEATDRLLRAGARTRIALERMPSDDAGPALSEASEPPRRRRSATGSRHRG
jgi:hypothetical protein